MTKRTLLCSLAVIAVLVALVLVHSGCAPKRETLAVYHESSPLAASIAAGLEAKDKGGLSYIVAPTGSMEPTLHGGDFVVGVPTPIAELKVGMIGNYTPERNEKRLTIHRIVATWPTGGFVLEGDGEKNRAETKSIMDATNYANHVISVYRFP